jgi:hypothetical protein
MGGRRVFGDVASDFERKAAVFARGGEVDEERNADSLRGRGLPEVAISNVLRRLGVNGRNDQKILTVWPRYGIETLIVRIEIFHR